MAKSLRNTTLDIENDEKENWRLPNGESGSNEDEKKLDSKK